MAKQLQQPTIPTWARPKVAAELSGYSVWSVRHLVRIGAVRGKKTGPGMSCALLVYMPDLFAHIEALADAGPPKQRKEIPAR